MAAERNPPGTTGDIDDKPATDQTKRRVAQPKKGRATAPPAGVTADQTGLSTRNRSKGWDTHAGFNLYFENKTSEQGEKAWQTHVWHALIRGRELDEEKTFDSVTPQPWVEWIFQHADLPGDAGLQPIAQATPAPLAPAHISILGVEVEGRTPPDVRAKTLVASIRLSISGDNAEILPAERTPYQILLFLIEQERRLPKLVASEHGRYQRQQTQYVHQLEFALPELGRYE